MEITVGTDTDNSGNTTVHRLWKAGGGHRKKKSDRQTWLKCLAKFRKQFFNR